jgi:hypothetical protein
MGTGRDCGLFLTRSHGLARPRPNHPRVPIPVFVASALLLQPTQTLRSRGCHQSVLHSALDRRLYSGLLQVPMRLMRIRLRCQTKTMPLIEEPVTSGLTVERGTAESAG